MPIVLIDTLKNHTQKLDIIHSPEAKSINQQLSMIQRFIAQNIIVLMDKNYNFHDGKYEELIINLKVFYQTISIYQSKLSHTESFMSGGILHFIFPRKTSYQPLLKQESEEIKQDLFHCDKIKQAIEEWVPKPSKLVTFKNFFKQHTLSNQQASVFADCLIKNQGDKGIEI